MSFYDELLEESKPENGDGREWEYESKTGRKFTFRVLSVSEMRDVGERRKLWQKRTVKNTPHKDFHPYLPVDTDTATGISLMEKCLVSPKLTGFDLLRLSHDRPPYFLELMQQAMTGNSAAAYERDVDEVHDLGEFFGGMGLGDGSSPPEETPTANTTTT